jgi:ABC-type branched-subunit amino acid transport system substrate-binding protein
LWLSSRLPGCDATTAPSSGIGPDADRRDLTAHDTWRNLMDVRRLPARSRANSAVLLIGVVIGLLVAGLAIPFAFGERITTTAAAPGSDALSAEGLAEVAAGGAGGSDPALPDPALPDPALPDQAGGAAPGAPGTDPAGEVPGAGAGPVGTDGGAESDGAAGGQATGPSGGAGTGEGAAQQPRTATDRGVTADAIKVGFTLIDTGGLSQVGVGIGVTAEQQEAAWRAYVKDINKRGGINGRQVVPVFAKFDPLDQDSQRKACLRLTQDEKVFAVGGGFNAPVAISCVTRENQTPLFSGFPGTLDEIYQQSNGLFVTFYPRASRLMDITVAALDAAGKLKGRTIGILNTFANDPNGTTGEALEKSLKARGHNVKRRVNLSADSGTASSQVSVEVSQFQREGINTVFLLNGVVSATQFVQQADNQGYLPAYHMTDWSNNNNDFVVQNMPRSFEGTIGTTHTTGNGNKMPAGPENAQSARCRKVYDQNSGRKLAARGTAEYGATTQACDAVLAFEKAAKAAGTQLTRRRIAAAVQTLDSFPIANWGPGRFGSGKPDFSDQVRFHVFRSACKCWEPSGGFFSPR